MNRYKYTRHYQFHDLYYDFLKAIANEENKMGGYHRRMVDAYKVQCPSGWHSGPDDGYYFQQIAYHLHHAKQNDTLKNLLLDYSWIETKLEVNGVGPLLNDYAFITHYGQSDQDKAVTLIHQGLRLSSHVLHQDPFQLPSQLIGRLQSLDNPIIKKILQQSKAAPKTPWIVPVWGALTPPGGMLVQSLIGHTGSVHAVAVTHGGRYAVSGSDDYTLKVWDLHSGALKKTLEGHTDSVHAVAVTPDGRYAVSGFWDKTLKVWDLHSGALEKTLEGHTNFISSVAVTPDGRYAVSGSWDNTLKVWDLHSGALEKNLEGHTEMVCAVAVTPDGRYAVSGSSDKTLKVWDLHSGALGINLERHKQTVFDVAVTPDGRYAVSGSRDKTVRVWDLHSGALGINLERHKQTVFDVAVTPDGRYAVSCAQDKALKVWDLDKGHCMASFYSDAEIIALSVTSSNQIVVGDSSGKVFLLQLIVEYSSI